MTDLDNDTPDNPNDPGNHNVPDVEMRSADLTVDNTEQAADVPVQWVPFGHDGAYSWGFLAFGIYSVFIVVCGPLITGFIGLERWAGFAIACVLGSAVWLVVWRVLVARDPRLFVSWELNKIKAHKREYDCVDIDRAEFTASTRPGRNVSSLTISAGKAFRKRFVLRSRLGTVIKSGDADMLSGVIERSGISAELPSLSLASSATSRPRGRETRVLSKEEALELVRNPPLAEADAAPGSA